MRITVIGTGYVGLVTGTALAYCGHDVTCVDMNPERVSAVNQGIVPFHEPGLPEMLSACVQAKRLRACTAAAAAVAASDITFLAVGTPSRDGAIDLSYLRAAAEQVGLGLRESRGYHVVAVKSTVVPGTTDTLVREVLERTSGRKAGSFGLCMNPEFLREGSAVADFMEPDRIVIGQWDERSGSRLGELYRSFDCPHFFTTLRNAEMTKYASNALLATLISFSNELAAICEATPGANVSQVLDALHLDRRLSTTKDAQGESLGILSYLRAGCGFGGSCLPKDVSALRAYARQQSVQPLLLDAVAAVNESRPRQLLDLVDQALGTLQGADVAVLGLAFKPGTDDLRDSPALATIRLLQQSGAVVRAYDPMFPSFPEGNDFQLCASGKEALTGADAALIVTAWPEFAAWDWAELCSGMRRPILIDGRNALAAEQIPQGVTYVPIGKAFERQEAVLA